MFCLVYFVLSLQLFNVFKVSAFIQHPDMYRTPMMNPVGDNFDHVRRVIVSLESPVLPKLDVKRIVDDEEWQEHATRKKSAQEWLQKLMFMQHEGKNMCIALMQIDANREKNAESEIKVGRERANITERENETESVMLMKVAPEHIKIVQNILNLDRRFTNFKLQKNDSKDDFPMVWECASYKMFAQRKEEAKNTQANTDNEITTTAKFTLQAHTLEFKIIKPTRHG